MLPPYERPSTACADFASSVALQATKATLTARFKVAWEAAAKRERERHSLLLERVAAGAQRAQGAKKAGGGPEAQKAQSARGVLAAVEATAAAGGPAPQDGLQEQAKGGTASSAAPTGAVPVPASSTSPSPRAQHAKDRWQQGEAVPSNALRRRKVRFVLSCVTSERRVK